jgi:transcriptional regulator
MMYTPAHYKATDQQLIERLIHENQFATLIVAGGDEPSISHLPLLLRDGKLIGHMARMNPQWRSFPCKALSIFTGPHGYISPAWYEPAPDNVPTWNYVAAHVRGQAQVIESIDDVFATMETLVKTNEEFYGTGWKLERNIDLEKLSKAIVAFEISDLQFDGKFKLSQKIEVAERESVIAGLEDLGYVELVNWMIETRQK